MDRRIRWTGQVACMGVMRNAYKTLAKKPERKTPHGRPRCRWDIRIYLTNTGWKVVDWMHLAQDRD
jgi:hypothetical protein